MGEEAGRGGVGGSGCGEEVKGAEVGVARGRCIGWSAGLVDGWMDCEGGGSEALREGRWGCERMGCIDCKAPECKCRVRKMIVGLEPL